MAVLTPASVYAPGRKPPKSEIVQLLEQMMSSASAPAVVKQSKAALDLVTPASEGYGGRVLNDPDPTKNGDYYRSGGVWVKGRGFPDTLAKVSLAGSANAQTGTVLPGVDPSTILVYFAAVAQENTGPMTLSIVAEAPRPVVNAAGNPLSAGEWTGVVLFYLNDDGQYQILIDAGAVVAAAQSASAARDWAQSDDPVPEESGGDGVNDRSAKWWAGQASAITVPDGTVTAVKLASGSSAIDAINNKLLIDPERQEWLHRAALLDPAAYTYLSGLFDATVPAGETWLVVNAWWCNVGSSVGGWFHRQLKNTEAFELTAGSRVKGSQASAFFWACRPALVADNPEYADPKKLYFQRLAALRAIALSQVTVTVPPGSARGTVVDVALPTDFEDGMLVQVSTHDTSWTVLALCDTSGGSNTLDEVSDDHQMRLTGKMIVPFRRKLMPSVRARASSVSGNSSDTSVANAHSVLIYQKLPGSFRTTPKALYASSVMADNPRIYYQFDEGSGTLIDNVGSAGAAADAAVITPVGFGYPGAIADNGTGMFLSNANSGRLEIPGSVGLDFGSGDFTIEGWFNLKTAPNAATADPWLVNAWQNPTGTPNSFLLALYSQKLRFHWKNSTGTTFTVDSSITIQAGTYYHVICGRAGANIFIRVVGKETRKTTAVSGSMATLGTNKVLLGAGYVASITYLYDGAIDELAVFGAALSDARADAHHALSIGW